MAVVVELGWTPVRGTRWLQRDSLRFDAGGVEGDRAYSAVTRSVRTGQFACVRAIAHPELMRVVVDPELLPRGTGTPAPVIYWGRSFEAEIFADPLGLGPLIGERIQLARTAQRPGFVWDCAVSVVTLSMLRARPGPLSRYRANVIIDDLADPLHFEAAGRLRVGEVELQLERPIDRCRLLDHDPTTGRQDRAVLAALGADIRLGWGARVIRSGSMKLGTMATTLPSQQHGSQLGEP